jgi:ATP-dependent Clp protease ATP-binding subunit ClpB
MQMEIRERCSWQHSSGKTEIEDLKYEAERAERDGDYGKVAEIRYGKLKAQEKLAIFTKQLQENQSGTS